METLTSLEFEFSAQNVHQQFHHRVHGCEGIREEDEANDDGKLLVEPEGLVEGAVVDEDGEEGKDVECVELANVRDWFTVGRASHGPVRSQVIWSCAQDSNAQARVPIRPRLLPFRSSLSGCHR